MTTNGSRRAVCAVALSLAACAPQSTHISVTTDAGVADVAREAPPAAHADARVEARVDVRVATAVDAGPPCLIGGTTESLPVTVACEPSTPGRLVIADDHVYWTVQGIGAVVARAALAGGAPEALVDDAASALGLAVDASYIYYTQPAVGRIMRVPVGGGLPVALVEKLDAPMFLALDGGNLYWTGGHAGAGTVMKLALAANTTPTLLIDGQTHPYAIAVQDGSVYWTDLGTGLADGAILRTSAAGPGDGGVRTASRLAAGLQAPGDLVLAGGFAYATDQAGRIARVPLVGGALTSVASFAGRPYGVATDGLSIYWSTTGAAGEIFKAPLLPTAPLETPDGGIPALVSARGDARFLAVSATDVYWATSGARPTIQRFAK